MDVKLYTESVNGHYEVVFRRAFTTLAEAQEFEDDTAKCGVIEFVDSVTAEAE